MASGAQWWHRLSQLCDCTGHGPEPQQAGGRGKHRWVEVENTTFPTPFFCSFKGFVVNCVNLGNVLDLFEFQSTLSINWGKGWKEGWQIYHRYGITVILYLWQASLIDHLFFFFVWAWILPQNLFSIYRPWQSLSVGQKLKSIWPLWADGLQSPFLFLGLLSLVLELMTLSLILV